MNFLISALEYVQVRFSYREVSMAGRSDLNKGGISNPTAGRRAHPGGGLDEMDRSIVRLLQKDGRMSNTDIARQLEVTETTVRKRIGQLLDQGLMNIVAVPTPEAVGMSLSSIIGVSVDLTSMHAVGDAIRAYPQVRYVGMSAGRYDLIIEAFFSNQEQLLDFVTDKLGALDGVNNIETSVILKVVKFSYEWEIA
jgi:Lrp/AsnC family transcriptional regulator, regulator for asnA, asnC and gidA